MPYIEQYVNAGSTTSSDYFLISRNNVYFKLSQSDLYNEIAATVGGGITLGSIDEHTDVDITSGLVTGSLLRYDGTNFIPTAVADFFRNGGDTAGAERRLGNNDAYDLILETNNTARITILDTGEIGIGTDVDATIDDAQLFVQSTKSKQVILYNSSGQPAIYFQENNDGAARMNVASINAFFTDDTAGAEYGYLGFGVNKADGLSVNSSLTDYLSISQYYDSVGAAYATSLGVCISNSGVSDPTALLDIQSTNASGVSAANHKLLRVAEGSGGTIEIFDIRSNGWILAASLPTADTGLPVGCFYVETAANILANGDLVVGYKQ